MSSAQAALLAITLLMTTLSMVAVALVLTNATRAIAYLMRLIGDAMGEMRALRQEIHHANRLVEGAGKPVIISRYKGGEE